MNNNLFMLMIFWGVWIIIPVIFDGVLTLVYMVTILLHRPFEKKYRPLTLDELPMVSVIIPAYNEADNIDLCLSFLETQSYPQERLEIIVVDNGSTDSTGEIVESHMAYESNLKDKIKLVTRSDKGKAEALNTGIRLSCGEIIINIDCRSFLAKDAVYNMVAKFIREPQYGAITGNIEIDWSMVYERDENGGLILGGDGQPIQKEFTQKEKFLFKSQFLEYLAAFHLGRQFQDITDSVFTLSGAFSAFRRDCLLNSHLYESRTVSEDTDLTMDLMGQDVRIGFCADATAYLKPVISLEKFYAQRVRWARGQIEVIGLHLDWYANLGKNLKRGSLHGFQLLIDHTFGFPRLLWTFLLPLFFIFGYSMTLIVQAILLMYAFYVFIDFINACFCWRVVDRQTKLKIYNNLHYVLVTPFFRLITFYSRFAAYLIVLKEPPSWSTPISPVKSTKSFLGRLYHSYNRISQNRFLKLLKLPAAPQLKYEEKFAEIDDFGLGAGNGFRDQFKIDGISHPYHKNSKKN